MSAGTDPDRLSALFYLVAGLTAMLASAPKTVTIEMLGQPVNVVPVLWAVDGSWFVALFCAYLAVHGRFGGLVRGLAERFENFFLVTVPLEMAYIVGFVTLALSNTWVWQHFVPLMVAGILSLYCYSTRREWLFTLRRDYETVLRFYRWLKHIAELVKIRRKIHHL